MTENEKCDHASPEARRSAGPLRVLYIVGDPRCGSTMLQHLLGLQDDVYRVGELQRLQALVATGGLCACGSELARCSFWTRVAAHLGEPLGAIPTQAEAGKSSTERFRRAVELSASYLRSPRLAGAILRSPQAAAGHCLRIHRAVGEVTGRRVVVDSSKTPAHFMHMYLRAPETVAPVFLVRDGRGIVWSKMRRTGIDVVEATTRWLRAARMILAARRIVPAHLRPFVQYERLCADPHATLRGIVERVGLVVRTTDLTEMDAERHDLGGSPRFHDGGTPRIQLDERWRTEMPAETLAKFEELGRTINAGFGYH